MKIFSMGAMVANDNLTILERLRDQEPGMTPALGRIGRFVLANPDRAFRMSITELARETDTKSESTVVRFYRALDFESYHEFKVTLATEIAGNRVLHAVEDITRDDSSASLVRKYFAGVEQAIHANSLAVDPTRFEETVTTLERASRIILVGQAASSAVTLDAYFKFTVLGLNCHWSVDPHVNAVVLADPKPGDVVLAVSHSGESIDVVNPLANARPIAKVIAITESPDSPLGSVADIVLPVVTEEMNYRTDAVVSRIVQSTLVGALFLALLLRRGDEGADRLKRARASLSHVKY